MTYFHAMKTKIEGIRALAPPKWRSFDGIVGVHWDAVGHAGANGYYLSPDPRIVLFFNDVSDHIRVASEGHALEQSEREMARVIYVPAGIPLWTKFIGHHQFSHLDLHVHTDRLMRYIAPAIGSSAAQAVLKKPVALKDPGPLTSLAHLLLDELTPEGRHHAFGAHLVGGIVTGLLNLQDVDQARCEKAGRLTQAQLNQLSSHVAQSGGRRISVSEMAEVVGLSVSWFATVFRQTTNMTPLQWQLERRIEQAQTMLAQTDMNIAEISTQLGFVDQAHMTKVFKNMTGETPAVWRRDRARG